MPPDTTAVLSPIADAAQAGADTTRLEFQAALQLLNERACSIARACGSAVALEQGGVFSYCTATGTFDREPGTHLSANNEPFLECFAHRQPVHFVSDDSFHLLVPILRDEKAAGIIEVVSDRELDDETKGLLKRVADLVSVALEHRDAGEKAEKACFDGSGLVPTAPMRWHAPETAVEQSKAQTQSICTPDPRQIKTEAPATQPLAVPEARSCAVCGFPVSTGRALCVECEQKPHAAARPAILELKKEESWIGAHGYTIASLVVSALTAAIIFWLRR